MIKTNFLKIFLLTVAFILILMLLSGCSFFNSDFLGINSGRNKDLQQTDQSATATDSVSESTVTETTEPVPINFYFDEIIPEFVKDSINLELKKDFENFNMTATRETADILIEILPAEPDSSDYKNLLIYVPVVSFWSFFEESSSGDFIGYWNGSMENLKDITGKEFEPELIIRSSDLEIIEKALGKCKVKQIKIAGSQEELTSLLENSVNSFSVIPFNEITPKLKPVNLDGFNIFDKNLKIENYPITFKIAAKGEDAELVKKAKASLENASFSNRDLSKLVTVVMTGVTAMARQIARGMDKNGTKYPAEKVVDILRNADITHISNEVSFVEGCDAGKSGTVFCSKPEYMELLKYVGTDVIELTGNHLNDYGSKWLAYTLDIYDKEGIAYFGGGRNLEDSYRPATFEINGYRIAFVGANSFGPSSDWAGKDTPGSAPINMWDAAQKESDMQKMENIVRNLKSKGFIVIFTFQYMETYNYYPTKEQMKDFRAVLDAGADIVSGSQAHQPMGVEFRGNGFINYGLGNLFFGQASGLGVRQGIIAKHIFYDGKYINTVLITTMIELIQNYCQPRPAYGTERAGLLKSIFGDIENFNNDSKSDKTGNTSN
ncbi:MAG: CapA family protein [Actinobacteria bacterium]|nr:CapA family protein [Actinomycetota bacterium]